jgi:hypothetical protein
MKRYALTAAVLAALPLLAHGQAPARAAAKPAPVPPLEVSVHLRGEGLEHLMTPGTRMDCTGGSWTFDWAGRVPGEAANSTALLNGDGMFYTEDDRAGWTRQPNLQGPGIRCTVPDGATGRPVLAFEGRLAKHPDTRVDVQVSMEAGNPYISVGVTDATMCRVQLPQGQAIELPVPLTVKSAGPQGPGAARFHRPVSFTKDELDKGFSKTWQVSAQSFVVGAAQCMGQTMQGEVTLRYKSAANDPQIEFNACMHLAKGESKAVVARGTPEGGSYQFAASPRPIIDIIPIGGAPNQATVSGQAPGRGEFTASYTASGKSAAKTVPASVVELLSIDGSKVVQELGLIDAEGKRKPPVKFAFQSAPAAAGDLLVFKASNASVSVATGAGDITVQPVKPGTAVIAAQTLCGTALGPELVVKVVTCDSATREALERRKRSARERNDAISRRVSDLLNDSEFERVEREIADDVKNLAIKTAESVVGALTLAQGAQLGAAEQRVAQMRPKELRWLSKTQASHQRIEAVNEVYDLYDTTADLMEGLDTAMMRAAGQAGDDEAYEAAATGVLAGAVKLLNDDRIGLGKSFIEAGMAAAKMGRNLGVLAGVADRLAELDLQHDDVRLEWERVAGLLRRCDKEVADDDVELIAPPTGSARPPQNTRKPPARTPPPREIEVQPEPSAPPRDATPGPEPIKDPIRKPPTRVTLPLCATASSKPADVATSLRRAKSAYEAYAQRMQAAAQTVAQGPKQVLTELRDTVQQGPAAVRSKLPALKVQHDEAYVALAREGDAALAHLRDAQQCETELPLRAIDLKKIEWRLGP